MATTFTQAKSTLDEIAARSEANRQRLNSAIATIATALSDLNAMGAAYSTFVSALDSAASANPSNAAWQNAKAEKDQMVADFNALVTRATSMSNAVSGL